MPLEFALTRWEEGIAAQLIFIKIFHSSHWRVYLFRILKKKLFKEELEPQWPGPDRFWDWDWWMRWPEIRRDRECVIPDLSRTYHFGTRGVSVAPYFQDLYFFNRTLNTEANVRFDVHNVTKDNYENVIENLIR